MVSGTLDLRQRLWRWHFFAGLVVCPFAILLALTGAIYLFKPQIERYQEAGINALALTSEIPIEISDGMTNGLANGSRTETPLIHQPINHSLNTLLAAYPGTQLKKVILNKPDDPTVEFELRHPDGQLMTYWVAIDSGQVLASKNSQRQFLAIVKKLHSELMLGNTGSYIVELMASWLIILIVSGVYLWTSAPGKPSGDRNESNRYIRRLLIPAVNAQRPIKQWRSIHGVAGAWFAIPIVVFLLTGLPWTQLWGSGFEQLKRLASWQGPGQEWRVTLQSGHAGADSRSIPEIALWEIRSDDSEMAAQRDNTVKLTTALHTSLITLDTIANIQDVLALTHPVYVMPPKPDNGVWTVRAMPAQRAQRVTLHYDQYSGEEIMRIAFRDHHPVQQFISQGISLHEGALFGWLNQLLGVLTALAVIGISSAGLYMWWLRKPVGKLGTPKKASRAATKGFIVLVLSLALFLPAAGLSFLIILLLETLWIKRLD